MSWKPSIKSGQQPIYMRLAAAIEEAIATGELAPGARLPPQRDLAFSVGLGLGAVSRAYAEAERRGLLRGHVGRGTFVAGPAQGSGPFSLDIAPEPGVVDLARNRPPPGPAAARLHATLSKMQRNATSSDMLDYPPPAGLERHRRVLGTWMARGRDIAPHDPRQLVITNGAQQAMGLAFGAVCRSGETVLCESATFQGMKALSSEVDSRARAVV